MGYLPELLSAARGDSPCDLVLKGGRIVNTFTCELLEADVGIRGGFIAGIGEYRGKQKIDVKGKYISPGFIEGHYHIESSLLRPSELSRIVVPRGTTCMVADPHEIANVAGMNGIEFFLADSEEIPMDLYLMAPSCVPSTGFDTSGATITSRDVEHLYRHLRVLGLGEVMDYPAVVNARPQVLRKIEISEGRPVDGHAPRVSGRQLSAYIAAGPGSDHECTVPDEALEKARLGMTIMIREGKDPDNLARMLAIVNDLNCGQFILVTDDRPADELEYKGHLDYLLKRAVEAGMDPAVAVRLVTLNPARYFGLKRRGAVAPGYIADLVVLEDLKSFKVERVYKSGKQVSRHGSLTEPITQSTLQRSVLNTFHLKDFTASDLWVRFDSPKPLARVMELVHGTIITSASIAKVKVDPDDRSFLFDPDLDLAPVFVLERHKATGRIGRGLVRGFGLKRGAIASSFAHDSHNIICICADPDSAVTAIKALLKSGGGYAVAVGDELKGHLDLPICGLIHQGPYEKLLDSIGDVLKAARETGCDLDNPFFYLSFLSLTVVPELKITDKGLFDLTVGGFVDLEVGRGVRRSTVIGSA